MAQNPFGTKSFFKSGTSPSPYAIVSKLRIYDSRGRFVITYKGTGAKISITFKKNENNRQRIAQILASPSDGNIYRKIVELGEPGSYEVSLECDSNAAVGEINFLEKKSKLLHNIAKPMPKIAFVGDSFSEPTISDSADSYSWQGYPQVFARISNTNVFSIAAGGTGYIQTLGTREAALIRIDQDVIPLKFDIIVLALGINDNTKDPLNTSAELGMILELLQRKSSKSLIYVLSPFWPKGIEYAPSSISKMNSSFENQCGKYTFCKFLDLWVGDGYIQGDGSMTTPTGKGNSDWITGTDGTHPSVGGHDYIAKYILNLMLR